MGERKLEYYKQALELVIDCADSTISDILPSVWNEENRRMGRNNAIPGGFSYDNSPYTREIVDRLALDDSAEEIAIMKGAQIGLSTGFVEAGIGWIISENPGNILYLVGHDI